MSHVDASAMMVTANLRSWMDALSDMVLPLATIAFILYAPLLHIYVVYVGRSAKIFKDNDSVLSKCDGKDGQEGDLKGNGLIHGKGDGECAKSAPFMEPNPSNANCMWDGVVSFVSQWWRCCLGLFSSCLIPLVGASASATLAVPHAVAVPVVRRVALAVPQRWWWRWWQRLVTVVMVLAGFLTLAVLRRMHRQQVAQRLKSFLCVPTALLRRDGSFASIFRASSANLQGLQEAQSSRHCAKFSLIILSATIYVSNIGANVLNKQMLKDFGGCPLSGCALIFGIGTLFSLVSWQLGLQKAPKELNPKVVRMLAPVVALQFLTAWLTQLGVARLDLSLFHTIKATEPLWTALLSFIVLGMVPTCNVVAALVMIILGVTMSTSSEVSLDWGGFLFAVGANVTFVMKNVLAKRIMKKEGMDGLDLVDLLTIGAFAVSLPVALFFEGVSFAAAVMVAPGSFSLHASRVLGACAMFHVYQVSSMLCLSWFSPITHSVVNSLKRPTLVIMSIVFFNTPISWLNALGIVSSLAGVHMYGRVAPGHKERDTK